MITTTLGTVAAAEDALRRLSSERLPVKTAYALSKLVRLAAPEAEHFRSQRLALIRELGAERAITPAERAAGLQGPTVFQVKPEHVEAFTARLNDLGAIPVEIAWNPIALSQLDGATITTADLIALEVFLAAEAG